MSKRLTDVEESLFTLWSLYILIDQHYKALLHYKRLLDKEFNLKEEDDVSLDTIRESLIYQILLKVCAFADEWDDVFGVRTEANYQYQVLKIKAVAKPARRILNKWKDLRDFRNQAIAHNHRDRKGNNIYFLRKKFHTPLSLGELALMIYAIENMAKIASSFMLPEWEKMVTEIFQNKPGFNHEFVNLDKSDILSILNSVEIDLIRALNNIGVDIIELNSEYGDFLRLTK